MQHRLYDPERDAAAAHRIWRETGWIKDEIAERAQARILTTGRTLVAELDGEAECLVLSIPGYMRYLQHEVPIAAITAVTTSRVARKQGLAGRLTARTVAQDAMDGAAVSVMDIFEQGFYNRLGYGNGSYEHRLRFDPATLRVPVRARPPKRLTTEDAASMHGALIHRTRGHGSLNLTPIPYLAADMSFNQSNFGLGYFDGKDGALTHFLWAGVDEAHGPYHIIYMAFQSGAQFLELMALLKGMGDQVFAVNMREPALIQLQDMLEHPFRQRLMTAKSEYATGNMASAYWQARICNVEACLAATYLPGDPLRFNLVLSDPIKRFLEPDTPWQGVAGDYVVTLGPESAARLGMEPGLPTLTASVGAFTRLWLGVRPATGLAITDDLHGPDTLLAALNETLRLPAPHLDWPL